MSTVIVVLIIAVLLILDLKYLSKHGLDDCTGNCGNCGSGCSGGSCKWANDVKKAQRSIARKKKIRQIFHLG